LKQTEFCYWLQGYFELGAIAGGASLLLTLEQAACVRNHLELVKACNVGGATYAKGKTPAMKPITGFCAWLDGTLELALKISDGQQHISDISLELIKTRLNDEFLHVIDPQQPGDKEVLQATHDGLHLSSPQNNPSATRC